MRVADADLLIAIDDTDDRVSRGTGWLAQRLIEELAAQGLGECGGATRHQLLRDPRIPYTSHNSSACLAWFRAPGVTAADVAAVAGPFLAERSAPGSDPGLAVAERRTVPELVAFGRAAKTEVLEIDAARELARAHGVHLSGHGGTEGGVLGALAAVGLHLSGSDGFFLWMPGLRDLPAALPLSALRKALPIDEVDGGPADGDVIDLGDWVRPIWRDGRAVLLLEQTAEGWRVAPRYVVHAH
ncbi:hypothetical protein GCM10009836_47320 [Pseudonocardia ailaonensis]|uniref:Uncharacterized protein n=1 Tax=Pseudonocardia ailaonensis TaxID=367279 RepID=A0ABN2NBE7_9PSEU